MQAGEHVYLKFHPEIQGTVSKVRPDGAFRVTWTDDDRRAGQSRARFWYTQEDRVNVRRGVPA